ncbi:MAG: ATPase, partial [Saprospiraceae bacterium]
MTFFCVATFFKGIDFIKACKAAGNTVYVLTKKSLEHEAWPHDSIDEMFYVEHDYNKPENLALITEGLAYVMRSRKIDRIVSLDDFDVEKGAYLREHFRVPGMGQSTARYFRDKLAMRVRAAEAGINVPAFSPLFNDQEIHEYTQRV